MPELRINVFGRFGMHFGNGYRVDVSSASARQLLCYLLLNREVAHSREALADLLWPDATTDLTNTRLRKALWHLRNSLDINGDPLSAELLLVGPDWLQIDTAAVHFLDCAVFESSFARVQGIRGEDLAPDAVETVRTAVACYQGGLRENWYLDWYITAREQYHQMHLLMLDKLMDYHEARGEYEISLTYGFSVLRQEPARETTHQRQMRLFALLGDRSAALHQYDICVRALLDELGVVPSLTTVRLNREILAGYYGDRYGKKPAAPSPLHAGVTTSEIAHSLTTLRKALGDFARLLEARTRHGEPSQIGDLSIPDEPTDGDTPVPPAKV